VVPQTIEALLVSYIDDLDAKMNIMFASGMGRGPTTRHGARFPHSITGGSTRRTGGGARPSEPVRAGLTVLAGMGRAIRGRRLGGLTGSRLEFE